MNRLVRYFLFSDKNLSDLEELLSPYDEDEGVDLTLLIENGFIII